MMFLFLLLLVLDGGKKLDVEHERLSPWRHGLHSRMTLSTWSSPWEYISVRCWPSSPWSQTSGWRDRWGDLLLPALEAYSWFYILASWLRLDLWWRRLTMMGRRRRKPMWLLSGWEWLRATSSACGAFHSSSFLSPCSHFSLHCLLPVCLFFCYLKK